MAWCAKWQLGHWVIIALHFLLSDVSMFPYSLCRSELHLQSNGTHLMFFINWKSFVREPDPSKSAVQINYWSLINDFCVKTLTLYAQIHAGTQFVKGSQSLTRWQSPPDSTSWMKTAGPSVLLEPPPMVIPRLQERAIDISWITPSPGWLKPTTHTYTYSKWLVKYSVVLNQNKLLNNSVCKLY